MTQSRKPMSMPSSRLLVQMTPESLPSLRFRSVASRVALERELWCIPIGSFSFQTLNLFARASASDLVFVNIKVDLFWSTVSRMVLSLAATSGKVKMLSASAMSSPVALGLTTCSWSIFSTGTLTISHSLPSPTRNLEIVSGEPIVAESPIIWTSLPTTRFSRSSAMESWLPLLSSANSWTSSTTTHFNFISPSLILLPVRSAWSVSGVVMSMSGGTMLCPALSEAPVSPCLTPNLTSNLLHHHCILSSMSLLSALSGVM